MTEPLQWVLFTCEARTGKLVSGQYIVTDGVLFVRDPVRRRCGRTPTRMLRELYGGL